MRALGILAWFAIAPLANALIEAAALHKLWQWFVANEYGHGPSFGAWFGIATILGMIVGMAVPAPSKSVLRAGIEHNVTVVIARWIGVGFAMVMALAIGSLFGWIQ